MCACSEFYCRPSTKKKNIQMTQFTTECEEETFEIQEEPLKRTRRLRRFDWWSSIGSPKHVSAPMVDQSELAFRMLVRNYGVQLAYTPMINSKVFSTSKTYRHENFDNVLGDEPLIAQFCGDDPELLVQSARYIQDKVSAVDINFGCPQGIAKKGHYGSYLLAEPHLCTSLVAGMVSNLECPVTAKMRIVNLNDPEFQDTINLISQFESAGVDMVCLHTRTKEMNKDKTGAPMWEACRIVKERFKSFPIVCNGGIEFYDDVVKCMEFTGCDAVMSSEALLEKPNLFDPSSSKTQDELAKEYIECVRKYPILHRFETRCVRSHMFRFLYAGLQRHVDLRTNLSMAKNLNEIESIIDELAKRRKEEPIGLFSDIGWYRRHRTEVGTSDGHPESANDQCIDINTFPTLTIETPLVE
jgi:tRNA-dihydrouridine synthase 1